MEPLLKKNKADMFTLTIGIAYLTLCYFGPAIFGGEWQPTKACRTKPLLPLMTAMFGWAVLGSWLFVKLLWHLIVSCRAGRGNMRGAAAEYKTRWEIRYAMVEGFF